MNEKMLEIQSFINKHNSFLNKALSNINIQSNDSLDAALLNIDFSIGSLLKTQELLKGLKLATYEYKCTNEECEDFNVLKDVKIPMSEYSEDKLPICEKCNSKTSREYTAVGCQTFGDGYRS